MNKPWLRNLITRANFPSIFYRRQCLPSSSQKEEKKLRRDVKQTFRFIVAKEKERAKKIKKFS